MIAIHLAEGFEEIEALTVADVLRRAGKDAQLVSVSGNLMVNGAHGITVKADCLFEDADYAACEMLVLPGGMPGTKHLGEHQVLCGLGVVVGSGTIDRAIGEGVDVDGDEDVGIRLISDIAACLQLGVIVRPWTIDVLVGAAGHDDLRAGRGEHVAQRQGDGKGDIFLVNFLISFVSDGTDIRGRCR